mgnify:CR=1 FL=1
MTQKYYVTPPRNITAKDVILDMFVPLGYSKRRAKVVFWKEAMDRNPLRYLVNNLLVFIAIALYDHLLGPSGDVWAAAHALVALPFLSLFVMAARSFWHQVK